MSNINTQELTQARKLLPEFLEVASIYEVDEAYDVVMIPNFGQYWLCLLLGGIASRESRFGLLLKNGHGDGGHGHGIMQIDDRSHSQWIRSNNWRDPATNIEYGADVWFDNLCMFDGKFGDDTIKEIWAATAGYNCGAGNVLRAMKMKLNVDYFTTGQDYSADVRARMVALKALGWPR